MIVSLSFAADVPDSPATLDTHGPNAPMMRPSDGRQAISLLTLLGFVAGIHHLSTRFYTSAAFERPVFFTIGTLLICAVVLRSCRTRWTSPDRRAQALEVLRPPPTSPYRIRGKRIRAVVASAVDVIQGLNSSFRTLLVCLVVRTLLLWYTLRNAQCSWRGVEAFLPLAIAIVDRLLRPLPEKLPQNKPGTAQAHPSKPRVVSNVVFGLAAALLGVTSMWALDTSIVSTGAVCPVGWRLWPLTPYLQMTMCVLDAIIMVHISRLRRSEDDDGHDISQFMSTLFIWAAACTAMVAFTPILIELSTIYVLRLNYLEVRDLFMESCVAATVVLCAVSLLADVRPGTLALVTVGLGLFAFGMPGLASGALLPQPSSTEIIRVAFVVSALMGVLLFTAKPPEMSSRAGTGVLVHRWIKLAYLCVVGFCATWVVLSPPEPARMTLSAAIHKLVQVAEVDARQWSDKAASSQTLERAVAEYRRRYGITPPPNFDKWYEYAKTHKSPIIDSFDQIHNDLLPFWGVPAKEIRNQTAHLLGYAGLGMGGLRIRNGVLRQSPHIPGTHRWMAETMERMIQPFAQWLPDMDLAINLADECRVTVPYAEKQAVLQRASEARSQISSTLSKDGSKTKGWSGKTDWPEEWTEPRGDFNKASDLSHLFSSNLRKQLFYEWIAPTCSPGSVARNSRWWDRSTACAACVAPHSFLTDQGAIMAHLTMADDLCYQPDLAYLDGLILSPTVANTKTLLPVFSQSRVGGFSDILFPSPWNFGLKTEYTESEDVDWAQKQNVLFWRGTSSDGYASDGKWTGFLRARLVNEGYQQALSSAEDHSLGVNVSFAGGVSKCDESDCRAELATFYHWGQAVLPHGYTPTGDDGPLPFVTPFDEHWHYRHLIDMDGAGFSGRFLPFLQSRSLIYRASLFRTWFDERLREWHHYVPADIRLGRGFWSVVRYLASNERDDASKHTGDEIAQRIAQRGREWAAKALRTEDMQIYMFRLLLEWGRIVDDERETLGYVGS